MPEKSSAVLDKLDHPMLVVAALSGRAVGVAARRAGILPAIADLFSDQETRAAATHYRIVRGDPLHGFDVDSLLRTLGQFDCRWPLVYGSGFESCPDMLDKISRERPIWGNPASVVARVTQTESFFGALKHLNLPAPPIRRSRPNRHQHWLRKQAGSCGGLAVARCQDDAAPNMRADPSALYYQKRLNGEPYSVQFITNGRQTEILCFCRNWLAPTADRPYRFGGLSSQHSLGSDLQTRLADAVMQVSAYFSLSGLNSLDVLIDEESFSILEINPRPGAAIDILENVAPGWSIPAHSAACEGQCWPRWPGIDTRDISLTLCYADRDCLIPAAVVWPAYCVDRPHGPKTIAAGEPICGIQSITDGRLSACQLGNHRAAFVQNDLIRVASLEPQPEQR